jgi:hypothetical protein
LVVSIVKRRGETIVTHFWVIPHFTFFLSSKNIKYKKIKKYNSEKSMPKRLENGQNWLRRFKKYKK